MANYEISEYTEKNDGTWEGTVTVFMPEEPNYTPRKEVKFKADSKQELARDIREFVIKIRDNKS